MSGHAPASMPADVLPGPGFRFNAYDTVVCPHRDLSCCDSCVAAHPSLVAGSGAVYWLPNSLDRAALAALMEGLLD